MIALSRPRGWAAAGLVAGLIAGLDGGCGNNHTGGVDAAVVDAAIDAAAIDAASDPCRRVDCAPFSACVAGTCVQFPACPATAGPLGVDTPPSCLSGTSCRNGACVPDDLDVDHDGHPAATDCDETNPDIHPDAVEACNGLDDNCANGVDEGDPMLICTGAGVGTACVGGACVCADGNFDLDPTVPGCECVAAPAVGQALTCDAAIDVGSLTDNGQRTTVSGNIPNGRKVWYRFRAVDSPDTTCDNFHAAAKLLGNPGDQFRIRAFMDNCNTPIANGPSTEIEWATDFRQSINGQLAGQCPCWSNTPVDHVSQCQDDTFNFIVSVERVDGGGDTCASYNLELSNGFYDWQ